MYIFCDHETTGFDPIRNDIIVTSLIVADENLEVVEKYVDHIQPKGYTHWSEGAEEVHGFSQDQTKEFKDTRKAVYDLRTFLFKFKSQENLFICHAQPSSKKKLFDYLFLEQLFCWFDLQYDLYKVVKPTDCRSTILPREFERPVRSQKLNLWADHVGVQLEHHNAESDCNACYEIYKWQKNNMDNFREIEEHYERSKYRTAFE